MKPIRLALVIVVGLMGCGAEQPIAGTFDGTLEFDDDPNTQELLQQVPITFEFHADGSGVRTMGSEKEFKWNRKGNTVSVQDIRGGSPMNFKLLDADTLRLEQEDRRLTLRRK